MTTGVRWVSAAHRRLTCEHAADGVVYAPRFWEEAGMPSGITDVIERMVFPPRGSNSLRYRGNEVGRDVIHVNATWDRDVLADYSYKGRQLETMLGYEDIRDVEFLQRPLVRLNSSLYIDNERSAFNQIIVTRYAKERDRITRHHDTPAAIEPGSSILCVSFGARRVFSVYDSDGSVVWQRPMEPGSAIVMTAAANARYKHALGEITEGATEGVRYSIVFRRIAKFISRGEVEAMVRSSQRAKLRSETERLRRSAADVDYFRSMLSDHPEEAEAYLAALCEIKSKP